MCPLWSGWGAGVCLSHRQAQGRPRAPLLCPRPGSLAVRLFRLAAQGPRPGACPRIAAPEPTQTGGGALCASPRWTCWSCSRAGWGPPLHLPRYRRTWGAGCACPGEVLPRPLLAGTAGWLSVSSSVQVRACDSCPDGQASPRRGSGTGCCSRCAGAMPPCSRAGLCLDVARCLLGGSGLTRWLDF